MATGHKFYFEIADMFLNERKKEQARLPLKWSFFFSTSRVNTFKTFYFIFQIKIKNSKFGKGSYVLVWNFWNFIVLHFENPATNHINNPNNGKTFHLDTVSNLKGTAEIWTKFAQRMFPSNIKALIS